MNEIVQAVAAKAGISPDQAHKAVEAVVHFAKDKLPAGLGSHLEGLLSGGAGGAGGFDVGSVLGGLLGGEKK